MEMSGLMHRVCFSHALLPLCLALSVFVHYLSFAGDHGHNAVLSGSLGA